MEKERGEERRRDGERERERGREKERWGERRREGEGEGEMGREERGGGRRRDRERGREGEERDGVFHLYSCVLLSTVQCADTSNDTPLAVVLVWWRT